MDLNEQFKSLLRITDPGLELLSYSKLEGGISARVFLLEVSLPGGLHKWVLRQYGQADLAGNPHIARDEFHLLQTLHQQSLPTALPVAFFETSEHPLTPCLILEYLPGETVFAPQNPNFFLKQAAENLWKIHSTDLSSGSLTFLPQAEKLVSNLIFSKKEVAFNQNLVEKICQTLQKSWPLKTINSHTLLHGDFWPGNLLWLNGQLSGIIDWEDARLGDPLSDLSNARLEFLWAFDWQAMLTFTDHYHLISGKNLSNLAFWDAVTALHHSGFPGWELPDPQKQKMLFDFKRFVSAALGKIK